MQYISMQFLTQPKFSGALIYFGGKQTQIVFVMLTRQHIALLNTCKMFTASLNIPIVYCQRDKDMSSLSNTYTHNHTHTQHSYHCGHSVHLCLSTSSVISHESVSRVWIFHHIIRLTQALTMHIPSPITSQINDLSQMTSCHIMLFPKKVSATKNCNYMKFQSKGRRFLLELLLWPTFIYHAGQKVSCKRGVDASLSINRSINRLLCNIIQSAYAWLAISV